MNIIGIDIDSKKFGMVCIDNDFYISTHFYLSKCRNTDDRIAELYDEVEKLLIKWSPDKVYIEEPIYVQNFKATKAISESVGNCKSLCRIHRIAFETVHNKTWKKEIIGNGNCSKEDIKQYIIKKYPDKKNMEQDVYDAFGIALYGIKRNE